MAEYIYKSLDKNSIVESRATSREEIGNDIYPPVKEVLDKNNIPYTRHHSTQITINDYNLFDVVVCFDTRNYDNLKRMLPDVSKVIKLCSYDVDDPWYTREFDRCFNETLEGCQELLKRLDSE